MKSFLGQTKSSFQWLRRKGIPPGIQIAWHSLFSSSPRYNTCGPRMEEGSGWRKAGHTRWRGPRVEKEETTRGETRWRNGKGEGRRQTICGERDTGGVVKVEEEGK